MTREEVIKQNHDLLDLIETMLAMKDIYGSELFKWLEEHRAIVAKLTAAMDKHPDMIDHYIEFNDIIERLMDQGYSEDKAAGLAFSSLEERDPGKINDIGNYLFKEEK